MSAPAEPTVGDLLDEATRRLGDAGVPDPKRESFALMALALSSDRGGVVARKPDLASPPVIAGFRNLVARRVERRPYQHLSATAEFRGLDYEVNEHVLIPRPETEDLVQAVLDEPLPEAARVADLGTGSGCIAIALAVERPAWSVVAVDCSIAALGVARRNVARRGVGARVEIVEGDFGAPPSAWKGAFDAVVSNAPYIAEDEWRGLEPEVRDHEPKIALVPGPTGYEAYEVIAPAAFRMLRPGGLLALELGWTSEATARELVAAAGFEAARVRPDLRGIPRVLTARR